mmetsp:Transcript_39347/g.82753  ORF Transcript_39347/g.82753 Transcript_39347/m.82753 type:complete len:483 (+) Transcript_39347:436-1884(+)
MTNKGTPPSPRYRTILCELMAFFHEKPKPYPRDHEFSEDELAEITPDIIVQFMNVKTFGVPNPDPKAKITGSGYSSITFMKKAISFYMPEKENWDPEQRKGNPTKSQEVKELMQRVVTLGGEPKKKKKKREAVSDTSSQENAVVESDRPREMLQRMHDQNNEFVNILDTMGSALKTFSRSIEQIKLALETNNIAIRRELSNEAEQDVNDDPGVPIIQPQPIPEIEKEMKGDAAMVAESLQEFMNGDVVTSKNTTISSGADGFCTFISDKIERQMDIPEGFDFPKCDLKRAWRHWITGFPDFKMLHNGEIVDAPIRPLRFVDTGNLPQPLKRKFINGWRPILLSMQGDVTQMLENTPAAAMDEKFVQDSYNTAMKALFAKAPGMFADSGSEKYCTWKVTTWSRKIREQQLGQQQVKRRQELEQEDKQMPQAQQELLPDGQLKLRKEPLKPPAKKQLKFVATAYYKKPISQYPARIPYRKFYEC